MPRYEFRCANNHQFERYLSLAEHKGLMQCCGVYCPACFCYAEQIISAPLLVKASPDVCYDSPIDGTPITSMAQRREDLAKHGCIPYDPGMKQDAMRRVKDQDEALDKVVEQDVERAIETMPGRKRGELLRDIVDKGETIEYARNTPDG